MTAVSGAVPPGRQCIPSEWPAFWLMSVTAMRRAACVPAGWQAPASCRGLINRQLSGTGGQPVTDDGAGSHSPLGHTRDVAVPVVVIGAGVVGCSVAFAASRAGLQVTLIEAASGPGQGSNSTSSATVRMHYPTF